MFGTPSRLFKWYATNNAEQYKGDHLALYDQAAARLTSRQDLARFLVGMIRKPEGRTLEIAAGTGLVSAVLDQELADTTFLDYSSPALSILQDRLDESKANGRAVCASFLEQPFESDSFDTIVCVGGYRYVEEADQPQFWSENKRILKPGGSIICAQFNPRIKSMNGSALPAEVDGMQIQPEASFESRIGHGVLSLKTGVYDLVEYQLPADDYPPQSDLLR